MSAARVEGIASWVQGRERSGLSPTNRDGVRTLLVFAKI